MSEPDDDLELQALRRRLDDAFATTRPRRGFEDELWLRMQARRPVGNRLVDALAGFFRGIREVPAVPAAAVAALLVVLIGVGVLTLSGIHLGGGASNTAGSALSRDNTGNAPTVPGQFGRLPSPVFSSSSRTPVPQSASGAPSASALAPNPYFGPANLTWTGQLTIAFPTLPVFRYQEPSTNTADQFASALGAALDRRPAGYLGLYESTDYTLTVKGTVQAPPQGPAYFILSAPSLPAVDAAGGPTDIATVFLAEHSLVPTWPYTTDAKLVGSVSKARFLRQFLAPPYGLAYLVDENGDRYGLEVDLDGNRPLQVSGPLPVNMDQASYPIISADQAVRSALASSPAAADGALVPTIRLDHAEVVYVLVAAGDHSFYEPAFLFSGTFQMNGQTYAKRILVPAVDPTQRSS